MEVKEQCVVLMRNGAGFACIGNRSSPAWMGGGGLIGRWEWHCLNDNVELVRTGTSVFYAL